MKSEDGYLKVPCNWDEEQIEGFTKINERSDVTLPIKEIYGALPRDPLGTGRPESLTYAADTGKAEAYIESAHKAGFRFNFLFNAIVTEGREFEPQVWAALRAKLQWLADLRVEWVTVANQSLLERIKKNFPNFKVSTSVNCQIDEVNRVLDYDWAGADRIAVGYLVGRNFKIIKAMREATRKPLELLVNEPCLVHCSNQLYHQAIFCRGSRKGESFLVPDIAQVFCGIRRLEDFCSVLKASWYRPDDTKYLIESGVNVIKLAGRMQPTDWILKSAQAYGTMRFDDGNIYSLIEKQGLYSKEYLSYLDTEDQVKLRPFRFVIDNEKLENFIGPFVKEEIDCREGCHACGYCDSWRGAISYEEGCDPEEHLRMLKIVKDRMLNDGIYLKSA